MRFTLCWAWLCAICCFGISDARGAIYGVNCSSGSIAFYYQVEGYAENFQSAYPGWSGMIFQWPSARVHVWVPNGYDYGWIPETGTTWIQYWGVGNGATNGVGGCSAPPPTYTGHLCVTNHTQYPVSYGVFFDGTKQQTMQVDPEKYWCVDYTGTNFARIQIYPLNSDGGINTNLTMLGGGPYEAAYTTNGTGNGASGQYEVMDNGNGRWNPLGTNLIVGATVGENAIYGAVGNMGNLLHGDLSDMRRVLEVGTNEPGLDLSGITNAIRDFHVDVTNALARDFEYRTNLWDSMIDSISSHTNDGYGGRWDSNAIAARAGAVAGNFTTSLSNAVDTLSGGVIGATPTGDPDMTISFETGNKNKQTVTMDLNPLHNTRVAALFDLVKSIIVYVAKYAFYAFCFGELARCILGFGSMKQLEFPKQTAGGFSVGMFAIPIITTVILGGALVLFEQSWSAVTGNGNWLYDIRTNPITQDRAGAVGLNAVKLFTAVIPWDYCLGLAVAAVGFKLGLYSAYTFLMAKVKLCFS